MKTAKRQQSDKLKQILTKNGYAGKFPTIKWGNAFKDYYHYGLYKKKLLPLCDNDNSMLFMNSESVCRE